MFLLFFLKKSFPSAYLTKKPKKARLEHSVFQQDSRTHNNIVYSTDYSHAQNRQIFQESITGSHTQIADIAQTKILAAIPFFYHIFFPLYIFIAQINLQSFKTLASA